MSRSFGLECCPRIADSRMPRVGLSLREDRSRQAQAENTPRFPRILEPVPSTPQSQGARRTESRPQRDDGTFGGSPGPRSLDGREESGGGESGRWQTRNALRRLARCSSGAGSFRLQGCRSAASIRPRTGRIAQSATCARSGLRRASTDGVARARDPESRRSSPFQSSTIARDSWMLPAPAFESGRRSAGLESPYRGGDGDFRGLSRASSRRKPPCASRR
jgi:hypothetical protein